MSDTTRLAFLMQEIEGFGNVSKNRYDYATEVAEEEGHDEITASDELEGFRRLIDAAIKTTELESFIGRMQEPRVIE